MKSLGYGDVPAIWGVKDNHNNPQVHALLRTAVDIFGNEAVLVLIENLAKGLLSNPSASSESLVKGAQEPSLPDPQPQVVAENERLAQDPSPSMLCVLGLPDGYTWERLPVEVKLAKGTLRAAMAEAHGVVLRHEDSNGGDLYYALYDQGTNAFEVPAGYTTSRGRVTELSVNGGYRWKLVGVARTKRKPTSAGSKTAQGQLTLAKWRGREYESCHEDMAHSGNVRVGSLVRDIARGTLDYVADCDGKTALIERENGDLDDIRLTAQPSKSLRVVGYSSQYAEEVAARG